MLQHSPEVTEALGAIRRFVRVLRMSAAGAERDTGLSSAQLFVLHLLKEGEADSMTDLANRTMTDQSSVSTVVSRLEQKGLVSRTPSPADARRTKVALTEGGRQVLDSAPPAFQERLLFALQHMPPDALRMLSTELSQLIALMGASHEPPTFLFEDDTPDPG